MLQALLSTPFLFHELIDRTAVAFPDKKFITDDRIELTYSQFVQRGRAISRYLDEADCKPKERIVVACGTSHFVPAVIYACSKNGLIAAAISKNMKGRRLRGVLSLLAPTRIFTHAHLSAEWSVCPIDTYDDLDHLLTQKTEIQEHYSPWKPIDCDPLLIFLTSGTTDIPKCITLSHSNVLSTTESIARYLQIASSDTIFDYYPLSFDYQMYQIFMTAARAASLILRDETDLGAEFFNIVDRNKVSILPLTPASLTEIANWYEIANRIDRTRAIALSSVRALTFTSSAFPAHRRSFMRNLFPNAEIFSMYGLTECKRVSYLSPSKIDVKPNSVGAAIPNSRIRVVDDQLMEVDPGVLGQLAVEGRNVMMGYWGDQSETAERIVHGAFDDRLLLTGDYGFRDVDGDIRIKGRKDHLVKINDFLISTTEVESLIRQVSGIEDCAIIAVIDEDGQNHLLAFVERKKPETVDELAIFTWLRENLETHYMIPKAIQFIDKLPRTERGKISYDALGRYSATTSAKSSTPLDC